MPGIQTHWYTANSGRVFDVDASAHAQYEARGDRVEGRHGVQSDKKTNTGPFSFQPLQSVSMGNSLLSGDKHNYTSAAFFAEFANNKDCI